MSRLYTFGCSFTNYTWNTWADIIGSEYEVFENWGLTGAGNQFVINSLTECMQRNKLDSDDTVMIMWSTPHRDDRYLNGRWLAQGNVFNSNYPKEWQEKYCDPFGFLLRDFSYIACAKALLENLGVKYYMFQLTDFTMEENFGTPFWGWLNLQNFFDKNTRAKNKLSKLYKPVLDVLLPDVFSVIYKNDWNSCKDRLHYDIKPLESAIQERWDIWRGSDWPSLTEYVHNRKNLDSDVVQEIDRLAQDHINQHVMLETHDEKNVRYYDHHPTTEMHLEYLQKVLPNHKLPSSFPKEKTNHGYEFERF